MQGWIRLPRIIQKRSFWRSNSPYDPRSAFVYLLLSAAHETHDIQFDNGHLTVKEGEIVTSLRNLAEEWGWSVCKAVKYLQTLQRAGEIKYRTFKNRTHIQIVLWEEYQWGELPDNKRVSKSVQTPKEHTKDREKTQKETYNNVNQVNNDNKKEEAQILKFVRAKKGFEELTEEEKELASECAEYYEQMLKSKIDFNKLCILVYGSVEDQQEYGFGDWQTLRKALGYLSREELTYKVLHPYYYIWSLSRQKDFVEKMRRLTGSHSEESR